MAIHARSTSISALPAIQLYKGIKYYPAGTQTTFGTSRWGPYVALRILCRIKWNSKRPGLQAVTDECVLMQIKSPVAGAAREAAKLEVRSTLAKAFEAPKSEVGIITSERAKTRDLILEYSPGGTSFLGDQPEFWVSRAIKRLKERTMKK